MHLNRYRIEVPSETTVVKIFPFGDIHLGATNCDYDRAVAVRDMIAKDKHAYWIGMGDALDSITPSDKRWDAQITDWKRLKKNGGEDHDESTLVIDQLELADRFFDPIWPRCLGWHTGNHEDMIAKYHYVDVSKYLCNKHDVPYLGYTAMTRLEIAYALKENASGRDSGKMIALDIFSEHGGSGGGTEGNAINQLVKRFEQFRADILLKGHVHRRGISKRSEILWGPNKPIQRTRLAILTGHFLEGYAIGATAYPERKSMAPSELGSTVILIRPRRLDRGGPLLDAVNTEALEMFAA